MPRARERGTFDVLHAAMAVGTVRRADQSPHRRGPFQTIDGAWRSGGLRQIRGSCGARGLGADPPARSLHDCRTERDPPRRPDAPRDRRHAARGGGGSAHAGSASEVLTPKSGDGRLVPIAPPLPDILVEAARDKRPHTRLADRTARRPDLHLLRLRDPSLASTSTATPSAARSFGTASASKRCPSSRGTRISRRRSATSTRALPTSKPPC